MRLYRDMEILRGNYFIKDNELADAALFSPDFLKEGLSIYEVFRVIKGVPLFLGRHLERLEQSAARTGHVLTLSKPRIEANINRLMQACRIETGNIKMVIDYTQNDDAAVFFYVYFIEHHYPSKEDYQLGVDTITFHAERINPNAKVANIALNNSINETIKKQQVYEALLLDRYGCLSEGSRSNLFMIKDQTIYTAPVAHVLPGITRGYILELCQKAGFTFIETHIREAELPELDAIFLTGTSPNVLPVRRVNQLQFNSAQHPVVKAIMKAYENLMHDYITKHGAEV